MCNPDPVVPPRPSVDRVYEQLGDFARRAREVGGSLHPDLSLVAYTQLSFIDAREQPRAVDIAAQWGLDKSTVSRQIDALVSAGLIRRTGERPGRRGQVLQLTFAGRRNLAAAEASVRAEMLKRLQGWEEGDIQTFGELLARFNSATPPNGAVSDVGN